MSADNTQGGDLDLSQFEGMTPGPWTTSREDMDSFTTNPETGENEHVVYVYRCDGSIGSFGQPRIAVLAGPLDNARPDARAIAAVHSLIAEVKRLREELARREKAEEDFVFSLQQVHSDQLASMRVHAAGLEDDVERLRRERDNFKRMYLSEWQENEAALQAAGINMEPTDSCSGGKAVIDGIRELIAQRDELRAECERLRQQLNSANQQQQSI